MSNVTVRPAKGAEFKQIGAWVMEDRERDPHFRSVTGSLWRRPLYQYFVMPRYLRTRAHTWVAEQDGELGGFAVVEQRGIAIHVVDMTVLPGFDRPALVAALLRETEELARTTGYPFLRIAPLGTGDEILGPFRQAGFALLDYYLWVFEGIVAGVEPPEDLTMQPVVLRAALERRLHYLRLELDHSQVAGRRLLDAAYLPTRPPSQRSFEIMSEGEGIGFLIPRPDERGDGVLTLVLSTLPEQWGTPREAQILAGFASAAGRGEPTATRILLSTGEHCDRIQGHLEAMGMTRRLDVRPILFKELEGVG